MPIAENTAQRLVLTSGSTTLTLDKTIGKATLQRRILMWRPKPAEAALSDIIDISVDKIVDRASGVEMSQTMVTFRDGQGWAFPAADKAEAQANATAMREFLGLKK